MILVGSGIGLAFKTACRNPPEIRGFFRAMKIGVFGKNNRLSLGMTRKKIQDAKEIF